MRDRQEVEELKEIKLRPLIASPPITKDTPLFFTTKNGAEMAVWNGEEWVPESKFPMFIEEDGQG